MGKTNNTPTNNKAKQSQTPINKDKGERVAPLGELAGKPNINSQEEFSTHPDTANSNNKLQLGSKHEPSPLEHKAKQVYMNLIFTLVSTLASMSKEGDVAYWNCQCLMDKHQERRKILQQRFQIDVNKQIPPRVDFSRIKLPPKQFGSYLEFLDKASEYLSCPFPILEDHPEMQCKTTPFSLTSKHSKKRDFLTGNNKLVAPLRLAFDDFRSNSDVCDYYSAASGTYSPKEMLPPIIPTLAPLVDPNTAPPPFKYSFDKKKARTLLSSLEGKLHQGDNKAHDATTILELFNCLQGACNEITRLEGEIQSSKKVLKESKTSAKNSWADFAALQRAADVQRKSFNNTITECERNSKRTQEALEDTKRIVKLFQQSVSLAASTPTTHFTNIHVRVPRQIVEETKNLSETRKAATIGVQEILKGERISGITMIGKFILRFSVDSLNAAKVSEALKAGNYPLIENFKDTATDVVKAQRLCWLWTTHRYPHLRTHFKNEVPDSEEAREAFETWKPRCQDQIDKAKAAKGNNRSRNNKQATVNDHDDVSSQ